MEHTLLHLAATAAWAFFVIFVFAIIGVIAVIRWIVSLFTRAENAVETEVTSVGNKLHGG